MSDDANVLCMECGLCCDGTFYGRAALTTEIPSPVAETRETEIARLRRRGLRILTDGDVAELEQPCAALRDCLCTIYAERPRTCASYACQLRKRLAQGEVSLAAARATVREARVLEQRVRTALALQPDVSIWQGIAVLAHPETPTAAAAFAEHHGATLAAVSALIALVRAAFEPRFAGASAAPDVEGS